MGADRAPGHDRAAGARPRPRRSLRPGLVGARRRHHPHLPRRPPLRPHRGGAGRRPPRPAHPPRHRPGALRPRLRPRRPVAGAPPLDGPGEDPAALAAPGRRRRQHLRRRGAVAGRDQPRRPARRPHPGRPPPRGDPRRPRRRPGQRRHHPAGLPHRQRRGGPQPGRPGLLRPQRAPVPSLRGDAAQRRARRPHVDLVPPLPGPLTRRGHRPEPVPSWCDQVELISSR